MGYNDRYYQARQQVMMEDKANVSYNNEGTEETDRYTIYFPRRLALATRSTIRPPTLPLDVVVMCSSVQSTRLNNESGACMLGQMGVVMRNNKR